MSKVPTPHIGAKLGDIAKTVIMPGDPLRAKFIAETFLEDAVCFSGVRNMFGYTGTYNGKRVSVMGSGMGLASIGIYSYELFNFYDVDNIIRIGTAGSISENLHLKDIVIGMGSCTDSNYAMQFDLPGTYAPIPSYELLSRTVEMAKSMNLNVQVGNILCSDVFYVDAEKKLKPWVEMGVLAVEMESVALYLNAVRAKKNALCVLTVSDEIFKGRLLTAQERQEGVIDMAELVLRVAAEL